MVSCDVETPRERSSRITTTSAAAYVSVCGRGRCRSSRQPKAEAIPLPIDAFVWCSFRVGLHRSKADPDSKNTVI
eukprot:scaffold2541_cov262-Pinguiococcus_pyrenoidosus.AAC.2